MTAVDKLRVRNNTLERITNSELGFRIYFPKTVLLKTNVSVENQAIPVTAVLTGQGFKTGMASGSLDLLTIVNWPYRLVAHHIVSPHEGISSSFSFPEGQGSCADTPGTQCAQNWRAIITAGGETCDLTGEYIFNYTFECRNINGGQVTT